MLHRSSRVVHLVRCCFDDPRFVRHWHSFRAAFHRSRRPAADPSRARFPFENGQTLSSAIPQSAAMIEIRHSRCPRDPTTRWECCSSSHAAAGLSSSRASTRRAGLPLAEKAGVSFYRSTSLSKIVHLNTLAAARLRARVRRRSPSRRRSTDGPSSASRRAAIQLISGISAQLVGDEGPASPRSCTASTTGVR